MRKRIGIAKLAGVVLTGSLAGGLAAVSLATSAWSAEYEVRMPVEKTVRIAPIGETEEQAKAAADKAAAEKTAADKAAKQADKAPKTALGKAAEAAAAQEKAREKAQEKAQNKAKTPEPAPEKVAKEAYAKAAKTAVPEKAKSKPAAKKNVKPALAISADPDGQEPKDQHAGPSAGASAKISAGQEAQAEPAPKAAKAVKPAKAAPALDPKGAVLPAAPATTGPIALPADGLWVGELSLRYEAHSVILHAASSKAVEHVTWFNQAEPRKLALDLRGEWRKKGAHVLRADSGPVKNVIVGDHPDRLRLAVEFREGVVPASVDPKVETAPDGVTVTIPLAVELKP